MKGDQVISQGKGDLTLRFSQNPVPPCEGDDVDKCSVMMYNHDRFLQQQHMTGETQRNK